MTYNEFEKRRHRVGLKVLRAMIEEGMLLYGHHENGIDYTVVKPIEASGTDHEFCVLFEMQGGGWQYRDLGDDWIPDPEPSDRRFDWPRSAHNKIAMIARIEELLEQLK